MSLVTVSRLLFEGVDTEGRSIMSSPGVASNQKKGRDNQRILTNLIMHRRRPTVQNLHES